MKRETSRRPTPESGDVDLVDDELEPRIEDKIQLIFWKVLLIFH